MNECSMQERERNQVATYSPLPLSSLFSCLLALNGMMEQHGAWLALKGMKEKTATRPTYHVSAGCMTWRGGEGERGLRRGGTSIPNE